MLLHGGGRLEQLTIALFVRSLLRIVRSSLTLIFEAKAIVREASVDIGCICNWWCVSCQMKEAQPTLLPLWLTDELDKQKDIKPVS